MPPMHNHHPCTKNEFLHHNKGQESFTHRDAQKRILKDTVPFEFAVRTTVTNCSLESETEQASLHKLNGPTWAEIPTQARASDLFLA